MGCLWGQAHLGRLRTEAFPLVWAQSTSSVSLQPGASGNSPEPWGCQEGAFRTGKLQLLCPIALPGPALPLQGTIPRKTDRHKETNIEEAKKELAQETKAEL